MVAQHYRWDFIGLSTDTKPTPETSEKVVDGSTYYEANTSKLYVYCKDNWYEKTAGVLSTFDFSEIFNIGIDALNESGEKYVENIPLTEEQFNYVLNNLKSSKIAIAKEIHEIDENANEIMTMISIYNFIGANDSEWSLNFNFADYSYTFSGYHTEDNEFIFNIENTSYVVEESE